MPKLGSISDSIELNEYKTDIKIQMLQTFIVALPKRTAIVPRERPGNILILHNKTGPRN